MATKKPVSVKAGFCVLIFPLHCNAISVAVESVTSENKWKLYSKCVGNYIEDDLPSFNNIQVFVHSHIHTRQEKNVRKKINLI